MINWHQIFILCFTMVHTVIWADDTFDNDNNSITLQSYEAGIQDYIAGTTEEVSGSIKVWIDYTISLLPTEPRIIEIGSAFGRDARYIESHGYSVERSDAAEGFIKLLQNEGYNAKLFNILKDPFEGKYDLVFANAVFLHFTPLELQKVLEKIHASLSNEGILSFSVKHGEGEEWSLAKVGNPRYFCYWQADAIKALLKANGFDVIEISEDHKFLQIIARKLVLT